MAIEQKLTIEVNEALIKEIESLADQLKERDLQIADLKEALKELLELNNNLPPSWRIEREIIVTNEYRKLL